MEFNSLIPELTVSSLEKSLDFYINIIGFKIEYQRQEDLFAFISLNRAQLMLQEKTGSEKQEWVTGELEHPFGRGINLQIETENISEIEESLKKNNYPIQMNPKENKYRKGKQLLAQKEMLVMDPDGYLLRFAEDAGKNTANTCF